MIPITPMGKSTLRALVIDGAKRTEPPTNVAGADADCSQGSGLAQRQFWYHSIKQARDVTRRLVSRMVRSTMPARTA